jgi:uncharacterized protein YaaQ
LTAADNEGMTMRLVLAIVQDEDADALADSLIAENFGLTRINTAGGLLRQGNVSFLLGVEEDRLGQLLSIIRRNCVTRKQYVNQLPPIMEPGEFYVPYPVEVQVGGATVFVFDVERFERL